MGCDIWAKRVEWEKKLAFGVPHGVPHGVLCVGGVVVGGGGRWVVGGRVKGGE